MSLIIQPVSSIDTSILVMISAFALLDPLFKTPLIILPIIKGNLTVAMHPALPPIPLIDPIPHPKHPIPLPHPIFKRPLINPSIPKLQLAPAMNLIIHKQPRVPLPILPTDRSLAMHKPIPELAFVGGAGFELDVGVAVEGFDVHLVVGVHDLVRALDRF